MIEFNTKGFSELRNDIQRIKQRINSGSFLKGKTINIERQLLSLLDKNVEREVYQSGGNNKWYERTENLKNATRVESEGNHIYLYIDGDFLKSQPNSKLLSKKTGTAKNTHSSSGIDYSIFVENGVEYKNLKGENYTAEPRPFMQATYEQLEEVFGDSRVFDMIVDSILEGGVK